MSMLAIMLIGGTVLSFLCFLDYKKNVLKPKKYFTYYVAFSFFTLINWAVYFTLCSIFLSIDVTQIKQTLLAHNFKPIQHLTPFVIAFSYFGVGAGSFKVGTFEFRFYSLLLELFQNLFQMTEIVLTPPEKTKEGEDRYTSLEKKVIQLQTEADTTKSWDKLDKDWQDVRADSVVLIEQIKELNTINDRLSTRPITQKNLEDIRNEIKEKITHLWYSVNLMVSRFIIQLIFKNIKDRKRIEEELKEIGWLESVDSPKRPNLLSRLIGISLITGMLFGLITAFNVSASQPPKSPIISMWCGAIGFIIFSLFFSRFDKIKNIGTATILGAIGGFVGHFTWIFLDRLQNILKSTDTISFIDAIISVGEKIPYSSLIIGAFYGAFIAVVLFSCCCYGPNKLKAKYCLVSLIGGGIFVSIHIFFSVLYSNTISPEGLFKSLFGGIIALLGLAFATNIFHPAKDKKI